MNSFIQKTKAMVFQEAQDNGSFKGTVSLDKTPGQMFLSISKAESSSPHSLLNKIKTSTENQGTQPCIHIHKKHLASKVLPSAGDSNGGKIN